jgi:hypothetical protein
MTRALRFAPNELIFRKKILVYELESKLLERILVSSSISWLGILSARDSKFKVGSKLQPTLVLEHRVAIRQLQSHIQLIAQDGTGPT